MVDSVDWKLRRWKHKGSLPSRDSGFHHSSDPKSTSCWVERNGESHSKTIISVQSSTEKDADCIFLTDQSEGLTSNKKPRLGWGEGLAKYENKKVEGPFGSLLEGGIESKSIYLNAADKTSGVLGVLGSTSPTTSSSTLRSLSSKAF